jgi:hypothetical protein
MARSETESTRLGSGAESGMDASRHTFQTNYAFIMSCDAVVWSAAVAVLSERSDEDVSSTSSSSSSSSTHRWLDETNDDTAVIQTNFPILVATFTSKHRTLRRLLSICSQSRQRYLGASSVLCHTSKYLFHHLWSAVSVPCFSLLGWCPLRMLGSTMEDY